MHRESGLDLPVHKGWLWVMYCREIRELPSRVVAGRAVCGGSTTTCEVNGMAGNSTLLLSSLAISYVLCGNVFASDRLDMILLEHESTRAGLRSFHLDLEVDVRKPPATISDAAQWFMKARQPVLFYRAEWIVDDLRRRSCLYQSCKMSLTTCQQTIWKLFLRMGRSVY